MSSDVAQLLEAVRAERAAAIAREPDLQAAAHRLETAEKDGQHYGRCSCMLWALEAVLCATPELAVQTASPRHGEHVRRMRDTKWEIGFTNGKCAPVKVTDPEGTVSRGFMCGDPHDRHYCQFCTKVWSISQCDFPKGGKCRKCKGGGLVYALSGKTEPLERAGFGDYQINCPSCAGTGRAMCNKYICQRCRAHLEPDEDYCPDHRALAGFPPIVRREICVWLEEARHSAKCLRQKCDRVVQVGERALWFPERQRLMCEPDGEEYLRVAQ